MPVTSKGIIHDIHAWSKWSKTINEQIATKVATKITIRLLTVFLR